MWFDPREMDLQLKLNQFWIGTSGCQKCYLSNMIILFFNELVWFWSESIKEKNSENVKYPNSLN